MIIKNFLNCVCDLDGVEISQSSEYIKASFAKIKETKLFTEHRTGDSVALDSNMKRTIRFRIEEGAGGLFSRIP